MSDLQKTLETLKAIKDRKRFRTFDFFVPYPKQQEFMALGATKRERLMFGGNQTGKTHTGAFEATCHMTGEYPAWWTGKRFNRPTRGWIAGVTSLVTRDVQQKKLCGTPGVVSDFGTGMIPRELFVDKPSLARGITDAFDTIQVRHKSGGTSVGMFKSYEQGRSKFQGDTIDWGWGDEESEDEEVYNEFVSRLAGDGIVFTTFTPLFGRTKIVQAFLDESHPDRGHVFLTLSEAEHFSADEKAKRLAGYKSYERDARARGIPLLGSGAIYLTPETSVIEPPLEYIPAHWAKLWGVDFGIEHPFAAALGLWDRDNDVIHIHHTIRMSDTVPLLHAEAMKRIAAAVPVAWPHDGTQREKGSGEPIADNYRKCGLLMLPEHSTWAGGGYSLEAGVQDWDEREKTGRLKFAAHLSELLEERRFYHRKDGQIVKVRDDILSAVKKILMMKRFAKAVPLGPAKGKPKRRPDGLVNGVDFDVFGQ